MPASAATIMPRLLTRQQAAAYCGVSVATFSAQCPVRAVALGAGKRLERFDVQALDEWIDRMRGESPLRMDNWLDRI
jgi:hypothetical protein